LTRTLPSQAAATRPRLTEFRRALAQGEREIGHYRRAVAPGDFASPATALRAAEQRRTTPQAEVARLDGNPQSAMVQLTPAALEQHLQGMAETLRNGENGKVREGIEECWLRDFGGHRLRAR